MKSNPTYAGLFLTLTMSLFEAQAARKYKKQIISRLHD